ncbi:30S ribosomal protein S8 [Candidatus Aerophobetes bacterium]|uniref:Small ribosomal subunit protein uS8 n=1 Tax=Aerophobetes bacterium TaxID=2030807 RepID=A0A497E7H5_UNCAE|nr:MAG: 30S ribosomal protein S8 [Candidatus Aerophobetes bacterium]
MLTDPIADMLTRIRNANMVSKPKVELPSSTMKEAIAAILKREGFVKNYKVETREGKKILQIYLKYSDNGQKVITHLERVSKPGRRKYVKRDEIPRVLNGLGICILSTSKGILTGEEARRLGVGGEVLCYIW